MLLLLWRATSLGDRIRPRHEAFEVLCSCVTVFVKLVVTNPSNFHYDYDAMFSSDLGSSFERSGFNQTLSSLAQSLVEPVHRSGCLALANA